MSSSLAAYEQRLHHMRGQLDTHPGILTLTDQECERDLFLLWQIRFSAHGPKMTERVSNSLRATGQACLDTGLREIGEHLLEHANEERGHDSWMVDDLYVCCEIWNRTARRYLSPENLLAWPTLPSTRAYRSYFDLTEQHYPQGMVAIANEIERLSLIIGPPLVANARKLIDPEGNGFSFALSHVEVDQHHVVEDTKHLSILLEERPTEADQLAKIGNGALESYIGFINECLTLARTDLLMEHHGL